MRFRCLSIKSNKHVALTTSDTRTEGIVAHFEPTWAIGWSGCWVVVHSEASIASLGRGVYLTFFLPLRPWGKRNE
jgi:hypothetical protein